MNKHPRCAYCLFETGKCPGLTDCARCQAIKAFGWCNDHHRDAFYEELVFEKRMTLQAANKN